MRSSRTLPSGPDPELFVLSPSGNPLYIANEDDNMVTVVDVEAGTSRSPRFPSAWSRRAWASAPTAKWLVNTSETTNMAHFIDTTTYEITDNVLVDSRPRFAEFTADGKQVWVSAEIGGTVSVIDIATRQVVKTIGFEVPGVTKEAIQPVGVRVTKDRQAGIRRAWAGQPGGGHRRPDLRGEGLSARRPAGLAARLQCRPIAPLHAPTESATTFPSSMSPIWRSSSPSPSAISPGALR